MKKLLVAGAIALGLLAGGAKTVVPSIFSTQAPDKGVTTSIQSICPTPDVRLACSNFPCDCPDC